MIDAPSWNITTSPLFGVTGRTLHCRGQHCGNMWTSIAIVARVWKDREDERVGAVVEPLLHWAKLKTIECKSQYVPCTAGILTGVVYANGDVSVCETHSPLGNLRQKSFFEIWDSKEAKALRARIKAKECYCTNEVFLWPSIVFQPVQLAKAMLKAKELETRQ